MAIEKHFIDENVKKLVIRKYTESEVGRLGCGEVDIYRTPMGMRILIHAEKPGLIIGRKGKNIQSLTDAFTNDFKVENPQLEVQQIEVPELNAALMAQKIASALERGIHFRQAVYSSIKRMKAVGVLGCEVTVSGKLIGERARVAKFIDGFIKHSGERKEEMVVEGHATAKMKPGAIGIRVKLVPPGTKIKEIEYAQPEEPPATVEKLETKPEAKPAPEEKPESKPETEKNKEGAEEKLEEKAKGKEEDERGEKREGKNEGKKAGKDKPKKEGSKQKKAAKPKPPKPKEAMPKDSKPKKSKSSKSHKEEK